jgi:hypothetical protein
LAPSAPLADGTPLGAVVGDGSEGIEGGAGGWGSEGVLVAEDEAHPAASRHKVNAAAARATGDEAGMCIEIPTTLPA